MSDLLLDKYIYFDISGNKPVTKDCQSYSLNFLNVGNPSITCNKFGKSIATLTTEITKMVKSYLHCDITIPSIIDYDVIMTSGSSESIATLLNMFAQNSTTADPLKILTMASEHHTTIQCCEN